MASTSVHLPPELLERLDRLAAERGMSRNRLIVMACRSLVEEEGGVWPPDFFSNDHLSDEEVAELRAGAEEMMGAITEARRSRREPPF